VLAVRGSDRIGLYLEQPTPFSLPFWEEVLGISSLRATLFEVEASSSLLVRFRFTFFDLGIFWHVWIQRTVLRQKQTLSFPNLDHQALKCRERYQVAVVVFGHENVPIRVGRGSL